MHPLPIHPLEVASVSIRSERFELAASYIEEKMEAIDVADW